jgi:hypothetical protein
LIFPIVTAFFGHKMAQEAKTVTYVIDRDELFHPSRTSWTAPTQPTYASEIGKKSITSIQEGFRNIEAIAKDPLPYQNPVNRLYYSKVNPAALVSSSKVFYRRATLLGVRYASAAVLWGEFDLQILLKIID